MSGATAEKGKQETAHRLAESLSIPVAYLYTTEDDLSEIILLYYKSVKEQKDRIKSILK